MKHLVILSCVSLLPLLSQAQTSPPVRIGLTAGATLTTRVGNGIVEEPHQQALAGVVAGVVAQLPLTANGHLFLQPELVYNHEGYRLSHPSTNYAATLRSSYVSLPLLVGVTTHGFFLMAGPQVGYLAGARHHYEFNTYSPTGVPTGQGENTDTNVRGYKRWEASLAAALGYRLPGGLGIELRYTEALTSTGGSSVFTDNSQPRNAGGQVRVSYLFH
jgi:hypothetical protein